MLSAKSRWRMVALLGSLVLLAFAAILIFHYGIRAFIGPASRPLTDRHFQSTPQRVARGKYLVEGTAHCFGCHSPIDVNSKTGEAPPAVAGSGDSFQPFPGATWTIPNLTPDAVRALGIFLCGPRIEGWTAAVQPHCGSERYLGEGREKASRKKLAIS